jgi:hypothetical protein
VYGRRRRLGRDGSHAWRSPARGGASGDRCCGLGWAGEDRWRGRARV